MATINVFQRYFKAECLFNGKERHGVSVLLISDSENGNIKYEVAVNFFPHLTMMTFPLHTMPIWARLSMRLLVEGPRKERGNCSMAFVLSQNSWQRR